MFILFLCISTYRIFPASRIPKLCCIFADNEHLLLPNGDLVIVSMKRNEEYSCTVKNSLTEQFAKSEALKVLAGKSSARLKLYLSKVSPREKCEGRELELLLLVYTECRLISFVKYCNHSATTTQWIKIGSNSDLLLTLSEHKFGALRVILDIFGHF